MAFDVYPQPATQPLNIGAGASVVTPFTEHKSAEAQPTMYIRVAMIAGATPPTFKLQAGTGDPVPVPSATGIHSLPGGQGVYVADSFLFPEANGVFFIQVLVYSSSTWKLTITNNDGQPRNFTFVVADSDASSRQPWIDMATVLPQTPGGFQTLVTDGDQFALRIFNYGTGPLTGLVGALTGANAGSFTFSAPATSINPNGLLDTSVILAPINNTTLVTATLTVTSNDPAPPAASPGHNGVVAISGTVEQLEVGFLLDGSGSMAYSPGGTSIIKSTPDNTRWGMLKTAAEAALKSLGLHASGQGTFGVGVYPDILAFPPRPSDPYAGPFPVPSPSANDFGAKAQITADNIDAVANSVTGTLEKHFTRENGAATPMGSGIAKAIGPADGSKPWGYFSHADDDKNLNRRWLILMTDGNHNDPAAGQHPDPADFFVGAGSFVSKKIHVATIGYGNPTPDPKADIIAPVNTTLLTRINNAGYQPSATNYHFVAATDDPSLTVNFIKTLLLNALDSETTADPAGVLTSNDKTVTREILVSQYDRRVSFIVSWTTYNAQRLRVQVVTPLGEVLEDVGHTYTVEFNPRFRMLTFDEPFLKNGGRGGGQPRYGTWKLIITLNDDIVIGIRADAAAADAAVALDSEIYDYQVMVDSRLRLRSQLNQVSFAPGDQIHVSALPTLDWQGLTNVAVTLSRTVPATSYHNWLAGSVVSAQEYKSVADAQLNNPDIDSLGIKQLALAAKGQSFASSASSDAVNMVDTEGKGVYVASLTSTTLPGTYPFYLTAVGTLPDGTLFRREQSLNIELVVRPDPAFTLFNVVYQASPGGLTSAIMTVRPGDRFGNVILIDPNFDPSILFTTTGGTFQGPIIDNHDGSYTRVLTYPAGDKPTVGVVVDGTNVVPDVPLVDVSSLIFVDKVFAFTVGREAVAGANQHTDPNACLNNFTTKPTPEFVSLGGAGVLVVGCAGKVIEGQRGDDDITVFVAPEQDRRAYSVEVTADDIDDEDDWVVIGHSAGGTQSFGLPHGHKHLRARFIRITDLSLRVRNRDGSPSATPGVSIVGVGVRKVDDGVESGGVCIRLKVLNPQRQPLGGSVDVEFQPHDGGETKILKGVDASKDIDVSELQRTPRGIYQVTVTPTDVFTPTAQFVTIPASGFETVEFIVDKGK